MLNALRLYADNLLCMDLCGWSGVDAIKLLGEEVTYSVTVVIHVFSIVKFNLSRRCIV